MTTLPPYAQLLGLTIEPDDAADRPPRLVMPPADHLAGRPGFLHGGALSGLLEMAAILAARHTFGDESVAIKPIGMTVDFLRGARFAPTYARGHLVRNGARIAAVTVEAWQDDETKPVTTARMNLSLTR
ncbi:PaaI family thioesterase [Sphingomonas arantia]|uniref:PaaI family thioesterase n=1 Tax=Sphingomonas arantia TaxID=1460676 RepID=A0ABW4U2K3_9SPHN